MSQPRTDDATLADALDILARDIVCEDGVATECLREAAARIRELSAALHGKSETMPENFMDAGENVVCCKETDELPCAEKVVNVWRICGKSHYLCARHTSENVMVGSFFPI